ncbi:GntR family transcriptional regulator [Pseudonocardia acaciae]|uniref:GntR family transcriptional regulator n=1 Tax=Pseudonocardia acaciae TaxID=551276 RepID=UPI0005690004|nr:GntR family transcriptional regulator [Pseudonocardia acaciae]
MPRRRRHSLFIARLTDGTQATEGSPSAVILDELRRCVLDGGVPPGTPIPPDEVAAVFGVSRIPVREALMTMVGEGLVEHRPNGGYTVARLTDAELHELYLVREVLETAALAAAVTAAGPDDDAEANAAYQALDHAVRTADLRAYHRDSRRFHWALVRPCGMRRLLGMLESAWNLTEPVQPMAQVTEAGRADLHADHDALLAAFLARDGAELVRVARRHHRRLQLLI